MPSSLETMLSRHSDALAGVFLHSDVPSLRDALASITDPRARRGVRYAFVDVESRHRPHSTGSRHWSTLKRLTRPSAAGHRNLYPPAVTAQAKTVHNAPERYTRSRLTGKRYVGPNTHRGHARS